MVAVINHSKGIRNVLNYNEQKVKKGAAILIMANKFLCEIDSLTFTNKLNRFRHLNETNSRTKTNTIHISLNFDPSERLSIEKLQRISVDYMNAIGFGEQPFLVYQHNDAGHPHVHVISSLIKADGQRINTHNIGRNLSEPARRAIEEQYSLVKADSKKQHTEKFQQIAQLKKANYGDEETKKVMGSIVAYVVKEYRFTSVPELNAVLMKFNILADLGSEESYLRKHQGIQYRILTDNGEKIGVPIKASQLPGRPTMAALNKRFPINEVLRKRSREKLAVFLNTTLDRHPNITEKGFESLLSKYHIDVIYRKSGEGRMYGITFVDNISKCVFNGSDLDKKLSANLLSKRFENTKGVHEDRQPYINDGEVNFESQDSFSTLRELSDILTADASQEENMPHEFSLRKARKKKRNKRK